MRTRRILCAAFATMVAMAAVGAASAQAYDNYFNGVINSGDSHYDGTAHNTSATEADSTGPNACTAVTGNYIACSGGYYDIYWQQYATGDPYGHNHDTAAHYYHLYWFA